MSFRRLLGTDTLAITDDVDRGFDRVERTLLSAAFDLALDLASDVDADFAFDPEINPQEPTLLRDKRGQHHREQGALERRARLKVPEAGYLSTQIPFFSRRERFHIPIAIRTFSSSQLFRDPVCNRFADVMTNRMPQFVAHSKRKQAVERRAKVPH